MIIFDYATLADDSHRRHFYKGAYKKWEEDYARCFGHVWKNADGTNFYGQNLEAYYAAADKDAPIEATLQIFHSLIFNEGIQFQIWCDLPTLYRGIVESTLKRTYLDEFLKDEIKMRPDGDTTPWHELKEKWVKEIHLKNMEKWDEHMPTSLPNKVDIEMAFELSGNSSQLSIDMWKRYGVPVMEVHI